jgi:hypothetical protein
MTINQSTIIKALRRSLVLFLFAVTAITSFAVLGDGKGKSSRNRSLFSRDEVFSGSFTLRTHYSYRGSQVINPVKENRYIDLNTTATYQKGNSTYIVPLKKKIYINAGNGGFTINH